MIYYEGTNLVQRDTLEAMIGNYKQAVTEIEQGYALLESAKARLKSAFLYDHFEVIRRNNYGEAKEEVERVMVEIKRRAWSGIVDRLELRKLLSIKRREELDKQLAGERSRYDEPVQDLPEITVENIIAMFQDVAAKAPDYAREAVYEIFDWLRPQCGRVADLKTNDKWKLGRKVIIGYAVEPGYKSGFRVSYHRDKNFTALDNVFHLLDGKGVLKTHNGPLSDAINATDKDGIGETDYFRFKCHKNHNLHIEFKRMDLVEKINKMAGDRSQIGN